MSVAVQRISTGYIPRKWQDEQHRALKRFSVLVIHRRAGKSHFATNDMLDYLLTLDRKNPQGAYIAPTFTQSKRVLWAIAKDYILKIPGAIANEAELKITIPRPSRGDVVTFLLLGAENPDGLRGLYLDYVILDEVAQMNPTVWTMVVRPALSDRLGRALFIGTCNGRGFFYQIYDGALNGFPQEDGTRKKDPEWHAYMLKASESGIIAKSELDSARAILSAETFAQEYECDFNAGMVGAYFAKEMAAAEKENRVCAVPYDASLPVDTYWDLGMSDVTAVWFVQQLRTSYRVIRYDEAPDLKISEWGTRVKKHGYDLRFCYLPHDVKNRELSGNSNTRLDDFQRAFGRRACKVVHRVDEKLDSINAARVILGKCWFDVGNCKRGLDALGAYQRRWDEKSQAFSPKPLHNWASNGCFAPETLVLTRYGKRRIDMLDPTGEVLTPCGWKPYLSPRRTHTNAPLVAVTFSDGLMVRCTPDHLFLTESGWKSAGSLKPGSKIQSSLMRSSSSSMGAGTGSTGHLVATSQTVGSCIAMFGRQLSELFQRAATFITETATRPITGFPILSASPCPSTVLSPGGEERLQVSSATTQGKRLPSGTALRPGYCGTSATPSVQSHGSSGSESKSPAQSAVRNSCASFAQASPKSGALTDAAFLTIRDVSPLAEKSEVWDLTVPDGAWFSLENGAVVHNSDAFQCFAMGASEREEVDERSLVRSYETNDDDPFTHARRHI